ncbi:MAG TPA: DsbC family protein [Geobacteraceae bacterium]|nr:DsbC family protein [Geobacteraceae bacterium]
MKNITFALIALVFLTLTQIPAGAATLAEKPEAAIKKAFPQLKIDSVSESQIKGLFEVVAGQNVFYFYPEKDLLFVGDMYTTTGQNITGEKKRELKKKAQEQALAKLKDLPLEKAVKIGNGPKTLIEFTDPDCPYCRRASEGLKNRTDVTRYVFLTPMAHPNAITKVYYILNAKDKEAAYHEMMEGKPLPATNVEYSKEIKDLAAQHMEFARTLGIDGTPSFFINGQQVVGADMDRINALLK